jgi:5'-AMP-activated protein kinase catalytic alpha subunit
LEDEWFKKGYKPACFTEGDDINVDDVAAAFNDSKVLSTAFFTIC